MLRVLQRPLRRLHASAAPDGVFDVAIVGGGIVGMATARQLSITHPKLRLCVLEKESAVAVHQSGHNSGVIHAGMYYQPQSMRALLCVKGAKMMYEYCQEQGIPAKRVGKLIVAVEQDEISRLDGLFARGIENGVELQMLDTVEEIQHIEPNCVGLKAIHSPNTGIVDYAEVARAMAAEFVARGGLVYHHFQAHGMEAQLGGAFKIQNTKKTNPDKHGMDNGDQQHGSAFSIPYKQGDSVLAKHVLTCAGLQADRVASEMGGARDPVTVPFRGEYLSVKPAHRDIVRGNIYPVPNPAFPFLGTHFTPTIQGELLLGPNAMLSTKREGYRLRDFNAADTADLIKTPGLRKLVAKNIMFGLSEFAKSIHPALAIKDLQRYVPSLQPEHVDLTSSLSSTTSGRHGVRAIAMDPNGGIIEDFVWETPPGGNALHVRNAPSPACTSSLAIAEVVAEKAAQTFGLQ